MIPPVVYGLAALGAIVTTAMVWVRVWRMNTTKVRTPTPVLVRVVGALSWAVLGIDWLERGWWAAAVLAVFEIVTWALAGWLFTRVDRKLN